MKLSCWVLAYARFDLGRTNVLGFPFQNGSNSSLCMWLSPFQPTLDILYMHFLGLEIA